MVIVDFNQSLHRQLSTSGIIQWEYGILISSSHAGTLLSLVSGIGLLDNDTTFAVSLFIYLCTPSFRTTAVQDITYRSHGTVMGFALHSCCSSCKSWLPHMSFPQPSHPYHYLLVYALLDLPSSWNLFALNLDSVEHVFVLVPEMLEWAPQWSTFRGSILPSSNSLWLTDLSHHHLVIGTVCLILGHVFSSWNTPVVDKTSFHYRLAIGLAYPRYTELVGCNAHFTNQMRLHIYQIQVKASWRIFYTTNI